MEANCRSFALRLTVLLRNQVVWWHFGLLEVRLLSMRCQHVHSAATCPFCCFSDDLLCGLLILALYKIALSSVGRWVGLWAYRCFDVAGWCWEVPGAAWGEACRPLGLVLSATNSSLTQSIWASIRCLRMGWMAGGKYFGVWTVSKGM